MVSLPACDRCYGNAKCYLHLHGLSSWNSMGPALPAVYSNPSSPGLIMGTGNVGVDGVGLDGNDGWVPHGDVGWHAVGLGGGPGGGWLWELVCLMWTWTACLLDRYFARDCSKGGIFGH